MDPVKKPSVGTAIMYLALGCGILLPIFRRMPPDIENALGDVIGFTLCGILIMGYWFQKKREWREKAEKEKGLK